MSEYHFYFNFSALDVALALNCCFPPKQFKKYGVLFSNFWKMYICKFFSTLWYPNLNVPTMSTLQYDYLQSTATSTNNNNNKIKAVNICIQVKFITEHTICFPFVSFLGFSGTWHDGQWNLWSPIFAFDERYIKLSTLWWKIK